MLPAKGDSTYYVVNIFFNLKKHQYLLRLIYLMLTNPIPLG